MKTFYAFFYLKSGKKTPNDQNRAVNASMKKRAL